MKIYNLFGVYKKWFHNYPIIPNGIVLYRGVDFEFPNNIGIGIALYFPAFLSNSSDINLTKEIARKRL